MAETLPDIRPLSEQLINQIAAGEVIERPASIVKELMENSIDAGAQRISVDIEEGGIERITVTDDGCGLEGAQLSAALRRHWTSKIATADELDRILSLGFRGEALASISAVADLRITARTAAAEHAWSLQVDAGKVPDVPRPAQGNKGCQVDVRRLFHHVPARKRFLKQARTELLHVQRVVRQIAFARPDVAIHLTQSGARAVRYPKAPDFAPCPRWRTLFGTVFLERARVVHFEADGVVVAGWVGDAELASIHSDLQYLALNGRLIRDRQLQHAVRVAFGEELPAGRYPVYALSLRMAPDAVDVNVHPGKLEVRFAALRLVHDVVHQAVRRALEPEQADIEIQCAEPAAQIAEPVTAYRSSGVGASASSAPAVTLGRRLALVDHRYLLIEREHAVMVLDTRAAWSEILTRRLQMEGGKVRPLLLPVKVSTRWSVSQEQELEKVGVRLADLGPAGRILRDVPNVFPPLDYENFVAALDSAIARHPTVLDAVVSAAVEAICSAQTGRSLQTYEEGLLRGAGAAGLDLRAELRELDAKTLGVLFGRVP